MIRLLDYSEKFRKKYFELCWPKVQSELSKHKISFGNLFPEAFIGRTIKKQFFEDILTCSITELIQKYDSVKQYHNIAFLTSLNMKKILKDMKARKYSERRILRQQYLYKCESDNTNTQLGKWTDEYIKKQGICIDTIVTSNETWDDFIDFISQKHITTYKFLCEIFSYETISRKTKYQIVEDLEICVCPYCNRQYINNIENEGDLRVTADIDHFYPQSAYFLWGISLYNFVPCCKICNSLFKSDVNMDIPYPYEVAYENDAKFVYEGDVGNTCSSAVELNELFGWNNEGKLRLKYEETSENIESIKREARLFHIESVYDIHSGYAAQLRYKKSIMEKEIDWVLDMMRKNGIDTSDKMRMTKLLLYGMDVADIDCRKVPLGKLIIDIVGE